MILSYELLKNVALPSLLEDYPKGMLLTFTGCVINAEKIYWSALVNLLPEKSQEIYHRLISPFKNAYDIIFDEKWDEYMRRLQQYEMYGLAFNEKKELDRAILTMAPYRRMYHIYEAMIFFNVVSIL